MYCTEKNSFHLLETALSSNSRVTKSTLTDNITGHKYTGAAAGAVDASDLYQITHSVCTRRRARRHCGPWARGRGPEAGGGGGGGGGASTGRGQPLSGTA